MLSWNLPGLRFAPPVHRHPVRLKGEKIRMKRVILLLTLFLLADSAAFAEDAKHFSIDSREFDGFERCNISNTLSETMNRLMNSGSPEKKEDSAWTYHIKSEVLGLPAHEMQIGVCDISGERSCGWGSYIAVVVSSPLEMAKKYLLEKFGTDFTKVSREKEFNITLRPVLVKGKNSGESVLFCDPGYL